MIYEYFCKLIFCTQTLFISSERPIALKVVSADTEYSATFNRIFGRIMPSKWTKIAPIFRLLNMQINTKFHWWQKMYILFANERTTKLAISLWLEKQSICTKKIFIFLDQFSMKNGQKLRNFHVFLVFGYRPPWPNIRYRIFGRFWPNIRYSVVH